VCGNWEAYTVNIPEYVQTDEEGYYVDQFWSEISILSSPQYGQLGTFDLWKMLLPGETISTTESTARVASYATAAYPIPSFGVPSGVPSYDEGEVYKDIYTGKLYRLIYDQLVGKITFSMSSNLLIGIGTSFLSELSPGDNIILDISGPGYLFWANIGTVQTVNSDTSLTLTANALANSSELGGPRDFFTGEPYWSERYFAQDLWTYTPDEYYYFNYTPDFTATFAVKTINQGKNEYAPIILYFDGNIVTKIGINTSRVVPLVGSSVYSSLNGEGWAIKNDCTNTYRAPGLQSWNLINNGQSVINWRALVPAIAGNPNYPIAQVIGGALAPGESVKSISTYNGNQKCISPNSLVYGVGGSAIFSSCV
jgi:hypothetical protein